MSIEGVEVGCSGVHRLDKSYNSQIFDYPGYGEGLSYFEFFELSERMTVMLHSINVSGLFRSNHSNSNTAQFVVRCGSDQRNVIAR